MLEKPRTFFAIHLFESKPYSDSAGKLEVREPMVQSGLLGEHDTFAFGWQESDSIQLVKDSVFRCLSSIGNKPVVIYGAGAHTSQYWQYFSSLNVVALADKNKNLWGKRFNGLPIVAPSDMPSYSQYVLISSRAFEANICNELTKLSPSLELFRLYGESYMKDALNTWCEELKTRVLKFKPTLLVHTPTHVKENIPKSLFFELKKALPRLKILTIWWDYDELNEDGGYLEYEREVLEYADLVIENSNASRIDTMQKGLPPYENHTNSEKVVFLPTWFDPSLFYTEKSPEDKSIKIGLFGSIVGDRGRYLEFLKSEFAEQVKHIGGVSGKIRQPVSTEVYASYLRDSQVVVNTQTYSFRTQCKGKVREAIQCGAILLEQENVETRRFETEFGPFNIFYFSSLEELKEKISSACQAVPSQSSVDSKKLCHAWTKNILAKLKD